VVWTGYASFFVVGWTVLVVPALIREVQRAFGQTDAGMGVAYLAYNALYIVGTLSGGLLAERLGRRIVLPAGPFLITAGMLVCTWAPAWGFFVFGFVVIGLGAGTIDSGVNALFMDLFAARRAGALNRLHLWFAIGAFTSPVAVGLMVGDGVPWQAPLLVTALAAALIGVLLATRQLPSGHGAPHRPSEVPGQAVGATSAGRAWRIRHHLRLLPLPLMVLAAAIGCNVAAETGVSSWLVRYLAEAPIETATLALSLFWAGLALGRLFGSLVADRAGPVRYAVGWSIVCGAAIIASLLAPSLFLTMAFFALAGFAIGPIYPMIMAIAGGLYPGRSGFVSGILASAAVLGALIYPTLMGFVSEVAGLGIGMAGAGLLSFVAAGGILLAVRLRRRPAHGVPVAGRDPLVGRAG
jgi:fucose permease